MNKVGCEPLSQRHGNGSGNPYAVKAKVQVQGTMFEFQRCNATFAIIPNLCWGGLDCVLLISSDIISR